MNDSTMRSPGRSLAQIEAARQNGAKSRGPVTVEGKAVSRSNAFKHGIRAEEIVVQSGEDDGAYRALIERLVERFQPADDIEGHLVRQLASVMWRTGRAERMEADLLSFCETISHRGGRRVVVEFDHDRFRVLLRYNRELEGTFYRTLSALGMLQNPNSPNEPGSENSY